MKTPTLGSLRQSPVHKRFSGLEQQIDELEWHIECRDIVLRLDRPP